MTSEQIKIVNNIKFSIINAIDNIDSEQMWKMLKQAYEQKEQQPCEDCISREEVDNYIVKLMSGYLYDEERARLEDLTAYIWELPSVTPKGVTVTDFADRCRECGKIRRCTDCYYNDGEVHAECVICDKAESED